jgi:hypothetical protein
MDADDVAIRLGRLIEAESKLDEARDKLRSARAAVKDAMAALQSAEQSATWRRAEYLRAVRALKRGDQP